MRSLPEQLLAEHHCQLRYREAPWQQVLRLNQSLWRKEMGYPPENRVEGPLGSALPLKYGEDTGCNLMSPQAVEAGRREVAEADGRKEKLVGAKRLWSNLLTSQALCFSLFADLQCDLPLASRVISQLLGKAVEVSRIELEYSPGRGDPSYTKDRSAADVYVEYATASGRGFLCVEVKYHEDLVPKGERRDPYRPRYSEVANQMGCFRLGSEKQLRQPPLEQLWRDHLLAGSILAHPHERFDEGAFVLLYPEINQACEDAVQKYRGHLASETTFRVWTLKEFLAVLGEHADHEWVWSLRDRYVDYYRVDRAYQDYYIRQSTQWAEKIRKDLGDLQDREAHRVQFRPSTTGIGMVGLLPEKPQLGHSYSSTAKLTADFEGEFAKYCDGPAPRRLTPEKQLQSFLVADALTHGRHMHALNQASNKSDAVVNLLFLTDELVIPSIRGDQRLDVLAVEHTDEGDGLVLIELKSERAMKALLDQTTAYAEFLQNHSVALSKLAAAILGREVNLVLPPRKWIVWPAEGEHVDPREAEFLQAGVRVVGYHPTLQAFAFRVGAAPEAQ